MELLPSEMERKNKEFLSVAVQYMHKLAFLIVKEGVSFDYYEPFW